MQHVTHGSAIAYGEVLTGGWNFPLYSSIAKGLFVAITFFYSVLPSTSAHAQNARIWSGEGYGDIDLNSSILWQRHPDQVHKYVYMPGMFGVIKNDEEISRTFYLEQYYNSSMQGDLRIRVRGTWPDNAENELQYDELAGKHFNNFISFDNPTCSDYREGYGYKCTATIEVAPHLPTGTIALSVNLISGDNEYSHPNSLFWIIKPEAGNSEYVDTTKLMQESGNDRGICHESDEIDGRSVCELLHDWESFAGDHFRDERGRFVVKLSQSGNSSLGSGFLTRSARKLEQIFATQLQGESLSNGEIYIVTAAHVLPISYAFGRPGVWIPFFSAAFSRLWPFKSGHYFNVQIGRRELDDVAEMVARDPSKDLALLRIRDGFRFRVLRMFGLRDVFRFQGLPIANHIDTHKIFSAFGYPAGNPNFVARLGYLADQEYPTSDTSNFGSFRKIKLSSIDFNEGAFAEGGMSGGPVLNNHGEVIAVSVERPVDSDQLIGVDITMPATVNQARSDGACFISYSPFDRRLFTKNEERGCNYGNFGSGLRLNSLPDSWEVQEVVGFADDDSSGIKMHSLKNRYGYRIINGHAIINGHVIINGHAIIHGENLLVTAANVDEINQNNMADGYLLDKDSFRGFIPKGVRILNNPFHYAMPPDFNSRLIVATKKSVEEKTFVPIDSLRDFSIWLHQNYLEQGWADKLKYN